MSSEQEIVMLLRDERDAHDPWHSPEWDDVWWWCDARIGDEFPNLRGVA